jgi:hypothetical protein
MEVIGDEMPALGVGMLLRLVDSTGWNVVSDL